MNKLTVSINIHENYYSKTWKKDIQYITDKQNNAQDVKHILVYNRSSYNGQQNKITVKELTNKLNS